MATTSWIKNADGDAACPEQELASDLAMFMAVETGAVEPRHRCWQVPGPVVVVGRHGVLAREVLEDACRADSIAVLRRFSGGGAVVLGPGCLNYAVALSLVARPALADVAAGFQFVLHAIATALNVSGLSICGTDLVLNGRKVSGNAQRRGRRALIHHGTLLYAFDATLATRYLREPPRQPAYRESRRHEEFLGNIPLPRDTIQDRLETAWRSLSNGDHAPRPWQRRSMRRSSLATRRSPSRQVTPRESK